MLSIWVLSPFISPPSPYYPLFFFRNVFAFPIVYPPRPPSFLPSRSPFPVSTSVPMVDRTEGVRSSGVKVTLEITFQYPPHVYFV